MEKENTKINYKRNLKEYFSFITKYKLLVILTLLSVTITEALFIADKFLYKLLIDDAEKFTQGILELSVFSQTILIIILIFIGIVILRSIGKFLNSFLLSKLDPKIMRDVKQKYFNHIIKLSHKFHATHKTGKLISRINRGTNAIENLTDVLIFQISPLIVQIILVAISLSIFSKGSAIIMAIMAILFISYSVLIQKFQNKSKKEWNNANDKERN